MSWRHWLTDLRDGRLIASIDIPSFSWSMGISDFGFQTIAKDLGDTDESSLTIPWTALDADTPAERAHLLSSGRRAICSAWVSEESSDRRGTPIMWGAIGEREDSRLDTTFPLVSPIGLLDRRYAIRDGQFHDGHSTDTVSYAGLSFRGLACELIDLATNRKNGGTLPFDLPYMGERGDHQRTDWQAWNVQNLGVRKLLDDLSNVQGGPDMTFRPYWSDSSHCRIRFLAGSDADVYLGVDVPPVALVSAPHGGSLENVKVAYSMPVQRVYATGAGTDAAVVTAMAEDLSQVTGSMDPPMLAEGVLSDTDCDDAGRLRAKVQAALGGDGPLMQVTGSIDADDVTQDGVLLHPLGSFWPGERFDLDITGFPSLPDGRYETRLMQMGGDQTSRVDLKFDVMPAVFQ